MPPVPRIAIIGAGPAGLTLGRLLHKRKVPFTLFEFRLKPTDEELAKPSGMLDLHSESGIAAMRECGLYNEFIKLTGECSEEGKVVDRYGKVLHEDNFSAERPEISRHNITKLLMSNIPSDRIRWGRKLVSATTISSSGHTEVELDFNSHGKETFDLVIGADGAWSKVRKHLTDVQPQYAGLHYIALTVVNITKKYPHLAELVGRGSFSALGNRHGIMSQRGPQDSARIYLFIKTDDKDFATASGLAGQVAKASKERLLNDDALFGTFGPTLKELVTVACEEDTKLNPGVSMEIRPLIMLPVGASWEHKPGATIIGDAAHAMLPTAGEGANLAMWDALDLAHAIIKAHEENVGTEIVSFQSALNPLLKDFETGMVARAKEKSEESIKNANMMFSENGAEAFAEFFRTAFQTLQASG